VNDLDFFVTLNQEDTEIPISVSSTSMGATVSINAEHLKSGMLPLIRTSCYIGYGLDESDASWILPRRVRADLSAGKRPLWTARVDQEFWLAFQRHESGYGHQQTRGLLRVEDPWQDSPYVFTLGGGLPPLCLGDTAVSAFQAPPAENTLPCTFEDRIAGIGAGRPIGPPVVVHAEAQAFVKRYDLERGLHTALQAIPAVVPGTRDICVGLQLEEEEGEGNRLVFRIATSISSHEFLRAKREVYQLLRSRGCSEIRSRMAILRGRM